MTGVFFWSYSFVFVVVIVAVVDFEMYVLYVEGRINRAPPTVLLRSWIRVHVTRAPVGDSRVSVRPNCARAYVNY